VSIDQLTPGLRQRVEDDLALATRVRQAGLAESTKMVANQVLGLRHDPRQIAHAQLLALAQGQSNLKPGSVSQRFRPRSYSPRKLSVELSPDVLGPRQVKAQQVTAIISHTLILTSVGTTRSRAVDCRLRQFGVRSGTTSGR
jgi:hypothetical protein